VFAVIYNFTYRMVWRNSVTIDGFGMTAAPYLPGVAEHIVSSFEDPGAPYRVGVCELGPFHNAIIDAVIGARPALP
jgi:hypothetical protein